MNQPSPAAAPAPEATPSGIAAIPSLEERVASLNESLDASSETAGEVDESAPPAASIPPAPAALGDAAKRAEERRGRLAALQARERQQVDRKSQQAAADKAARDAETWQRRAEEAEKQAASRVDISGLDARSFYALAEQKGINPNQLAEYIREAMTNPEKVAEAAALHATRTQYDPKFAALEATIARQNEQIQSFLQAQQHQQAAVVEQQQTHAFLGMVSQSAERAPLAARLLATDQNEFLQMAEIAAAGVPGMGPEALLDAVEELLDGDGRKVAQTYAALYGLSSQATAPTTPTTRGAAKPNTVSNSLAQERASLVEEENFARLPIEERAARLIRSMK